MGKNQIEDVGMSKESNEKATMGITMKKDPDPDAVSTRCTDGHIRRKTVDGICYCQMCCGGGWKYFCWDNGECVKCSDSPVTVNCSGQNRILSC